MTRIRLIYADVFIVVNLLFRVHSVLGLKMPLLVSKRGSRLGRTNNLPVELAVGGLCEGKASHQQRQRKYCEAKGVQLTLGDGYYVVMNARFEDFATAHLLSREAMKGVILQPETQNSTLALNPLILSFMPCHQKTLLILLIASIHFSCNHSSKEKDQLTFKINIYPAFEEYAEILLTRNDSLKSVSVYLANLKRPDIPNDTFWYTKMNLTNDQYRLLDSVLIKKCRNRTDTSGFKVVDGISIYSVLIYKNDTNRMIFQSPNIKRDSAAFTFTKSIFTVLPMIFKDSISSEYFAEMEEYIDASKYHKASKSRKIDRMRMEKYHWTIK